MDFPNLSTIVNSGSRRECNFQQAQLKVVTTLLAGFFVCNRDRATGTTKTHALQAESIQNKQIRFNSVQRNKQKLINSSIKENRRVSVGDYNIIIN